MLSGVLVPVTVRPVEDGRNFQTDIVLAEQVGESRGQLHRYLRLVELIPQILDLVDKKALALATAVEVSFLDHNVLY